jgi:hypothetical protein
MLKNADGEAEVKAYPETLQHSALSPYANLDS